MTTAYEVPSSGWKVTGQRQTQQLGGNGLFVPGVEVAFETGHGVQGNVFVPNTQYTPQNVADAIYARAAQLDAITGLSSPDTR